MTTIRRRRILLDPAGQSLAEVASDDVSAQTLGRTAVLSRWQEVEVEMTGGDRSLLEMAGKLLRGDGLRPAGRAARLERALDGWLPKAPDRPAPTASPPAGRGGAGLPPGAHRDPEGAGPHGAPGRFTAPSIRCGSPRAGCAARSGPSGTSWPPMTSASRRPASTGSAARSGRRATARSW